MNKKGLFITGTDTDIGKTFVSSIFSTLLKDFPGFKYFKPIQTGTESDTVTVRQRASLKGEHILAPVYHFQEPASPHRAADLENEEIDLSHVVDQWHEHSAGFTLAEGAGGLLVPLNKKETILDLMKEMALPVVLVSSPKLGTINHTLLSLRTLQQQGLSVLGVVISGDGDEGLEKVLEDLDVPVLFRCPQFSSNQQDWKDYCEQFRTPLMSALEKQIQPQQELSRRDKEFVWHPFTQHKYFEEFPVVESAKGVHLQLEGGHQVIDAMSSWWVNLHGHSHPYIAEAISKQSVKLEHVIFAGFTHEPAVTLSERLVDLFPKNTMERVFYSDNGSSSVEVAMKMAYQYQQQKGETGRSQFLALKGGYHGDTLGAMSLGGTDEFHHVFKPLMSPVTFVEPDDFSALEEWGKKASGYAACIVEPLLQGAGGMRLYSPGYLKRLSEICQEKRVLLIADEIFTGFYRTGRCFAFEHAGIHPDLVCLSKGLTGGFLPLAATVAKKGLFEAFWHDDLQKAFLHGHSYTANPMACAAANASLDLLLESSCQKRIQQISQWTKELLEPFKDLKDTKNVRSFGTLGAFDLGDRESYFQGRFSTEFYKHCLKQGVLCRPLGGAVYVLPPYCITKEQLKKVYSTIYQTIEQRMS